jgi:hypothetical protein
MVVAGNFLRCGFPRVARQAFTNEHYNLKVSRSQPSTHFVQPGTKWIVTKQCIKITVVEVVPGYVAILTNNIQKHWSIVLTQALALSEYLLIRADRGNTLCDPRINSGNWPSGTCQRKHNDGGGRFYYERCEQPESATGDRPAHVLSVRAVRRPDFINTLATTHPHR